MDKITIDLTGLDISEEDQMVLQETLKRAVVDFLLSKEGRANRASTSIDVASLGPGWIGIQA